MFEPSQVVVHPLVLLSIVDHYNRVTLGSKKRVVGVLLGSVDKEGKVDVTNSYARMYTHTHTHTHTHTLLCRASQHIAHSSSYCEAAATSHPPTPPHTLAAAVSCSITLLSFISSIR
jgi:hypothetical protein